MPELKDVTDTLTIPMGQLIAGVGEGVAAAQRAMDRQTIDNFKEIYAEGAEAMAEFRSIGYQPTWYAIPEAKAELAIALSLSGDQSERSLGAAPLDAGYASRFNFKLEGASKLEFRIVPVPPPGAAGSMVVAPELVGLSVSEARTQVEDRGLELLGEGLEDGQLVRTQEPLAGAIVAGESGVRVTAETPEPEG